MLTKEQIDNLHKAIDLAQGPGECEYVGDDGKACCVIGQYAFLQGVTAHQMTKEWGAGQIDSIHSSSYSIEKLGDDSPFLREIQRVWDTGTTMPEMVIEPRRAEMHAMVNHYSTLQELKK